VAAAAAGVGPDLNNKTRTSNIDNSLTDVNSLVILRFQRLGCRPGGGGGDGGGGDVGGGGGDSGGRTGDAHVTSRAADFAAARQAPGDRHTYTQMDKYTHNWVNPIDIYIYID